ncbi:MAG TPA: hypothetical protein VIK89_06380 [Cytophagaceae bacterium]
MKSIRLNFYEKDKYPSQNIYLKVVKEDGHEVLTTTDFYPGHLTLPVTFAITSSLKLYLYKEPAIIELWGATSGYITSKSIEMEEYKIIFPIEMDAENETVSYTVMGSWE